MDPVRAAQLQQQNPQLRQRPSNLGPPFVIDFLFIEQSERIFLVSGIGEVRQGSLSVCFVSCR